MSGLWVRSQDKKGLFYCNRITLMKCSGGNKVRVINQVLYQENTDDYDTLGEYDTVDRCIEVINDMQQFLRSTMTSIYEMPDK